MGKRHGLTLSRLRDAIAMLTIVGHLIVAFGIPLPFVRRTSDASTPYPCQFRPCGCASSDLCWKGDCCCFTLEEKLEWADVNGIEPPAHVRPLVETRKPYRPIAAKKKTCCPLHESNPEPVIWVVGFFAQKCRGDSPATLFTLEAAVVPTFTTQPVVAAVSGAFLVAYDRHTIVTATRPPTPPPRIA